MEVLDLNRAEKNIYRFLVAKRRRIALVVAASLAILVVSRLPYFNLYFSGSLIFFAVLALAILILDISINMIFKTSLLLFVPALLLLFIGRVETAELLGDYIYALLFIGVLKSIISFKSKRN